MKCSNLKGSLSQFSINDWFTSACVHLEQLELLSATPQATLTHLSCSSNFPRASYLDERTADVWINCFITFSTRWFKCCKGVNIPSATLQRVGNFVSGNISSSSAGSQLSMFSLNSRRSLNQFLIVKSQSKKIVEKIFFYRRICLRMSWACTIRIWSTLTQLNLIKQIYALCYNVRQCSS